MLETKEHYKTSEEEQNETLLSNLSDREIKLMTVEMI